VTSYADHVQTAARYAAALLTMPTPTADPDVARVRALQDDLAALLAEMTGEITGLRTEAPRMVDVTDVARHPVRMMLHRLRGLPARGGYEDGAAGPLDRLAGRPATPREVTTVFGAWQGLVAEMAQARHLLPDHAPLLTGAERWDALADVAALAETLATTRSDLLAGIDLDTSWLRRDSSDAAALAVEAREVARQAGTPTLPVGDAWASTLPGTGVVAISSVGDLPAASANLGRLLTSGRANITNLLAVTALLAQTSRAAAAVLAAATRHTPHPSHLPAAAIHLDMRADALSRAVAAERADLADLVGGSPTLLAQAREIGSCALPRMLDLTRNPARAQHAVPDLLAYAAQVPALTEAVRAGVEQAARRLTVAIRDDTDKGPYPWRPASTVDLGRFLANLTSASTGAALLLPPEPGNRPLSAGATTGLLVALDRRRDQLRPAKPATATLNGRFAYPRARRARSTDAI